MKPRQLVWSFVFLLSLTVGLAGCGDSDSSDPAANSYPYGVDSATETYDFDGDGSPDSISEALFSYNGAKQLTSTTSTVDRFDEETGALQGRTIITNTYNPDITPAREMANTLFAVSDDPREEVLGALLSSVEEDYEIDGETGKFYANPKYRREFNYEYTSAGVVLKASDYEYYDNDSDGVIDSSESCVRVYAYNDSSQPTLYTHRHSSDSDGDGEGAAVTEYFKEERAQYDAQGNMTSVSDKEDEDGDGTFEDIREENFAHTYEDGLLIKTVVTGDEFTQAEFAYDDKGQLESITTSQDEHLDDGVFDDFSTLSFTYDEDGRVTSRTQYSRSDSNGDEVIDEWERDIEEWYYDEDGLVTLHHTEDFEYSGPEEDAIISHSGYDYRYEYTDGYMSLFERDSLRDADRDGTFDSYYGRQKYIYAYDVNGYLIENSYLNSNFTNGELISESSLTRTVTYDENGVFMGAAKDQDNNGDDITDSSAEISLTYDDEGRVTHFSDTGVWFGDVDFSITYNDDETVDFTFTRDENTEYRTWALDFLGEGTPLGTKDFTFGYSPDVEYPFNPNVSPIVIPSGLRETEKNYAFKAKTPKILDFFFYYRNRVK